MQASAIRRLTHKRTASVVAAMAIVILAAGVVGALAVSSALDDGRTSASRSSVNTSIDGYENMRFLEENTVRIPYTLPAPRSFDEMVFIEGNTFQTPYDAPGLSDEEIRLMEERTPGYRR